jgi:uncharacterized ferritin-like protein (DUF455 family)
VAASRRLTALWQSGAIDIGYAAPPARPARPALRPPKEMPKRRNFGSTAGRIALLHALAHIELNAVDLGWDIIARFPGEALPRSFYDDWVGVACEEALHFELLTRRLGDFGAEYGELPAHNGLWESAATTAADLLDRLAVVPLVLEARGLDVTPEMAARLERVGDLPSAGILWRIYNDEIGHVAVGARWFQWVCRSRGLVPDVVFSRARPAPLQGEFEAAVQLRGACRCRPSGRFLRAAGRRGGDARRVIIRRLPDVVPPPRG